MENERSTELVKIGYKLVTEAFDGKLRKDSGHGVRLPYAAHLYDVTTMIRLWGAGTTSNLLGALFHDLIEDFEREWPIKRIFDYYKLYAPELFPYLPEVDAAIEIAIKLVYNPEEEDKTDYLLRIADYRYTDADSYLIKCADRFCNVLDYSVVDAEYARKYYKKAYPLWNEWNGRLTEIECLYDEPVTEKMRETKKWVDYILLASK